MSNNEEDVAIIELDSWNPPYGKTFIKILNEKGYRPIDFSDINFAGNIKNDSKMYAFGFPKESETHKVVSVENAYNWRSRLYAIPFVTTGQIQLTHENTNWFSGNIFVYHGFSGGPIVVDNKLVGIVHGGNYNPENTGNQLLPLSRRLQLVFMKTRLLMPLFKELQKRFP